MFGRDSFAQQRRVLGERVAGAVAALVGRLALPPRRRPGAVRPRAARLRLRLYFYRAAWTYLCKFNAI